MFVHCSLWSEGKRERERERERENVVLSSPEPLKDILSCIVCARPRGRQISCESYSIS